MPRVAVYTLRIMAAVINKTDAENQEVVDNLGDLLNDVEGQISNQLPEGYYCRIEDH